MTDQSINPGSCNGPTGPCARPFGHPGDHVRVKVVSSWDVHEGQPSWHQQRAGHVSAASTTGFKTRAEAESFADKLRANHPQMLVFVLPSYR